MSDSTHDLADLTFPHHSLCTLLLTRAGFCSCSCFAKLSYKRKHWSHNASFQICLIEYVFFKQIKGVDLYVGVKFWTFFTSKKGVDLYVDRLIHEYICYL